ncbi:MAG: exodeoxyribonuclease VII large subunit [Acidimicrobiales bacterium]
MELFPPEAVVTRLSLVKLASEIARRLAALGRVSTEGEVVKPFTTRSGRVYLTLRDRVAQVTVVCPPSVARRSRLVHGERVGVTGTLTWSTDRGQVHLVADEVVPVGAGAIAAALEETRRRLAADGLLGRPRRPIPRVPAVIGVVCGTDAAVRADIESVVAARFPGYPVVFAETGVSGPGAAASISAAMAALDARPEVEVLILARGGGDAATLLPFSDEELCRAICACGTPVVSAIGHEGDRPLSDEVADLRCGTPSLAATAVVPDRKELVAGLDGQMAAAGRALGTSLDRARARLERVDARAAVGVGVAAAHGRLERASARLDPTHLRRRLQGAAADLGRMGWQFPLSRRIEAHSADLAGRRRVIDALDPARVLTRGYAVVRGPDGAVLRSPDGLEPGDPLDVSLAAGDLRAEVVEVVGR